MTASTVRLPGGRRTGGRVSTARRRQRVAAYALISPFMVLFVAMIIVPLVYAGYLSLFREQLVGANGFVLFENYARALADPDLIAGIGRMCLVLLIQVPIVLALALIFALVIDSGLLYLKRFVRLSIVVPYAVPGVVEALMWGHLYGPDFGPFAQIAEALRLPAPQFLTDSWMLGSIMNIVTGSTSATT